jgi:uncharacterized membrane protein (DUF485 family)
VSTTGERPPGEGTIYEQIQASPDFTELRRKLRRFIFPMSAVFLIWYLGYVLLAAFESEFMSIKLAGNINVGLVIGLLQFVSTFAITAVYVRYAKKNLDPAAEELRERMEGSDR